MGGIRLNRRGFLKGSTAIAALGALPTGQAFAADALKIGYVSPQTGPLAAFGETDNHILAGIRAALKDGIESGGQQIPVEIIVKDSQSSPSRAAEVASALIEQDGVHLMLATATPDTTNPVSDQCELAEVACCTSAAPWEAWYFGRGGTPGKGFDWTFHYFFGLDEAINIYTSIWNKLPTNKKVGGLFPNDADGAAWSNNEHGLTFHLPKKGYELVNPGSFTNGTDNFASHISAFKDAGVDIITGVVNPPDWNTFWKQARQQDFKPKIATVAKALVFPASVATLGDLADGLTTEIVWSPFHPFKSSVTGESCQSIADGWTKAAGKPWTPPLGWTHAIFEVGIDALRRSANPFDRAANRDALAATALDTVMGRVEFAKGPFGKNVSVTPTVGGQWKLGGPFGPEVEIVANETLAAVPVGAQLRPLPY
jgi:branched-chain amino acid transport system substrate-binding protein